MTTHLASAPRPLAVTIVSTLFGMLGLLAVAPLFLATIAVLAGMPVPSAPSWWKLTRATRHPEIRAFAIH